VGRPLMPWVKLDDGFAENEKVTGLTDRGFRLHVTALCYCGRNLTDGYVGPRTLKILAAILGWSNARRWVAELVNAGLWIADDDHDGHKIKDFTEYNPTAEEVKEGRRQNAVRQADFRRKKKESNDARNALRNASSATLPRPDPTYPEEKPRAVTALRPAALGESGNGPGEISIDHVLKDIA
jgi:hypothetical protein